MTKIISLSLVFVVELHVKDLVRVTCDTRRFVLKIICNGSPWMEDFE